MESGLEVGEQIGRGRLERCLIGPPAVATELVFDIAPDALHQVQLGSIGWQPQRTDSVMMGHPPVLGEPTFVIADIVQDQDQRRLGKLPSQMIEKGHKGRAILGRAELPERPDPRNSQAPRRRRTCCPPRLPALSVDTRVAARPSPAGDGGGPRTHRRRGGEACRGRQCFFSQPCQDLRGRRDGLVILAVPQIMARTAIAVAQSLYRAMDGGGADVNAQPVGQNFSQVTDAPDRDRQAVGVRAALQCFLQKCQGRRHRAWVGGRSVTHQPGLSGPRPGNASATPAPDAERFRTAGRLLLLSNPRSVRAGSGHGGGRADRDLFGSGVVATPAGCAGPTTWQSSLRGCPSTLVHDFCQSRLRGCLKRG